MTESDEAGILAALPLILGRLTPDEAARILERLVPEARPDVIIRLLGDGSNAVKGGATRPGAPGYAGPAFPVDAPLLTGESVVADILSSMSVESETAIMTVLEATSPERADRIKRGTFQFHDILQFDGRIVQIVLRDIDQRDLILALKSTADAVKDKILRNMSGRARQMVEEDMNVMGPVRLEASREAQQKIVRVIRRLEKIGEITRPVKPGTE